MKYTLLVSFLVLSFSLSFSQFGSINSIIIHPLIPNDTDTITVLVDQTFSYSSCDLDTKGINVQNNSIISYSHHCVGMLTALCNAKDTFQLGPLLAGTYTLFHTTTSGMAPAPCSPGIVPDDVDTLQFEVVSTSGLEIQTISYELYPNPSIDQFIIENSSKGSASLMIYDVKGKLVHFQLINKGKNIVNHFLNKGIYIGELEFINGEYRVIKLVVK